MVNCSKRLYISFGMIAPKF